jgi:outer membrane protein W
MKKKIMMCFALGAALFLVPGSIGTAAAEPYMMLKGGIYSPESDDLDGFSRDVAGEISLGHYFNDFFALELGAGYFQTDRESEVSDLNIAESDIWAIPVTLSARFVIPLYGVKPYVMGGVGFYYVKAETEVPALGISLDDSDTTWGYHVGAGINFNITRNILLGVEAKYIWAEAEFQANGFNLDVDLDGFIATAALEIRF